ncbi:1,4-alpha-glucan branching enzyme domain protein [Clostridioides difficile CD90]|uniref:hypothetical protein n=1 Tax=Clostridioides difficile TaxID=1496 RepID=UPI00038DB052|nr:hypothetical protein [Clostridioides difficile]EQK68785.1 1,4-alpha-glucan branching enzyme domain protein [Clostridioides difficile CD90]
MKSQKRFKILDIDVYLQPFESDIKKRMKHYENMKSKTLKNYKDFSSFANAHLYYGFHQTKMDSSIGNGLQMQIVCH